MATVTGLTAERMQEIIDKTIVDADVIGDNLIFTLDDGSTIDAGNVRGPAGSSSSGGSGIRVNTLTPGSGGIPNPVPDGFEVVYVASATDGVLWHLRYNSGSASSYKWEYLGGPPLLHVVDTDQSTANAPFVDLSTIGPTLPAPLAGDYSAEWNMNAYCTVAANLSTGLSIGGAAPDTNDVARETTHAASTQIELVCKRRLLAVTAAAELRLKYGTDAGTANFRRRSLRILPVRVS